MKYYLQTMFLIFLLSCSSLEEPDRSIVVEAYIFENKPVDGIKLSLVKPINTASNEVNISGAKVFIIWKNFYYELKEISKPGYYGTTNTNLKIVSGNTYNLLIQYNNIEIKAQTTVPSTPINLTANKDSLLLNSTSDFIKVRWENPDSLWYLGVINPIDSDSTDFPFNNFFSIPTQNNTLEITPNDIKNIGNKQFILFGITQDYEDIYRISSSSIGSSNVGNIVNGFGIFSAFSSDTLHIIVTDK